jgi:hypothetical protein
MIADSPADAHSSTIEASSSRPSVASAAARAMESMTPVATSPPTITNRPAKNASVGHSTSLATSLASSLEAASRVSPPTMATTDGCRCSTVCSTNAAVTTVSTMRLTTSSRMSRMASRSRNAAMLSARSGS